MALLHFQRRTLPHGCSSCSDKNVIVTGVAEQQADSPPPSSQGLEVVGVQGRVQEMVLRFSMTAANGL